MTRQDETAYEVADAESRMEAALLSGDVRRREAAITRLESSIANYHNAQLASVCACSGTLHRTCPSFQPDGLGNDEGTEQMGGQAHAEAKVDETGTATATASAPEADTSADESSTEDTQGETASSDSE